MSCVCNFICHIHSKKSPHDRRLSGWLGSTLDSLLGSPERVAGIRELLSRLTDGSIKEVILATNPDVEGEATAAYIARLIKPLGVRVTRIAHGIPVGADLEYTDEVTLSKAFSGRSDM